MPLVTIPQREVNAVDLPPVCVVTGATDGVHFERRKLVWSTAWWNLVIGILCASVIGWIFAVALMITRAATAKRLWVDLPFSDDGLRRERLANGVRYAGFGLFGSGALLLPAGLWLGAEELGAGLSWAAAATVSLAIAVLAIQAFTTGRNRVVVKGLDLGLVELAIPSAKAAAAIEKRVHGWNDRAVEQWATRIVMDTRPCARHAGEQAQWTCGRCGNFACDDCLRRARHDAMPLCEDCFGRRPGLLRGPA